MDYRRALSTVLKRITLLRLPLVSSSFPPPGTRNRPRYKEEPRAGCTRPHNQQRSFGNLHTFALEAASWDV